MDIVKFPLDLLIEITAPVVIALNTATGITVLRSMTSIALASVIVYCLLVFMRTQRSWKQAGPILRLLEPVRSWLLEPVARANSQLAKPAIAPFKWVAFQLNRKVAKPISNRFSSPLRIPIFQRKKGNSAVGETIGFAPAIFMVAATVAIGELRQAQFDISAMSDLSAALIALWTFALAVAFIRAAFNMITNRDPRGALRSNTAP